MRKKTVAILIKSPPHGSSAGREALDAALALSDQHIVSLFFIGAGLFHLLHNQNPNAILGRDYIKTFKLLPLYDVEKIYCDLGDLEQLSLSLDDFFMSVNTKTTQELHDILATQEVVLSF